MLRIAIFAAIAALNLISIGAEADTPVADCQAHFTSEGNLFAGKKFTTWVEFSSVAKPEAYSRAYTAISKDGYQIVNADKDAGIISASQSVSFGKGTTAPLVIVVEPSSNPTGSKLTATFRIGGGQTVKPEVVRAKLCEYLGAAQTLVSQIAH